MRAPVVLQITNLDKKFPGVHALKDVTFSIQRGQIHGLVGENGAGKSTLIKSITGAYTYDSGEILFIDEEGVKTRVDNPLSAKKLGIAAAYQDLMVAPELTVGENFFLGRVPKTSLGTVDWNYSLYIHPGHEPVPKPLPNSHRSGSIWVLSAGSTAGIDTEPSCFL